MVDKKLLTEENFILFTIILATLVVILFIVNQGTSKNSSIIQKNISYNIYSLKGKDQFNGAFFLELVE